MSDNEIFAPRTTVLPGRCRRCITRKAESSDHSAFQLCTGCAADLCPGADVKRYNELKAQYGYAE